MKLRFVIQEHFTKPHHYDWMFETQKNSEKNLMTWSVEESPEKISFQHTQSKKLQNHRNIYLEYEGPISNDRGFVKIYDNGYYETITSEKDLFKFQIEGKKTSGTFVFMFEKDKKWVLYKEG